jgi:electron transfer flavoprotein beta subunit
VPAFLAAHLEAGQALGLIEVTLNSAGVTALRRLDGGRRERLRVDAPAVLSVEGATATLRRAPLSSALAARTATIENVVGPAGSHLPTARRPFRPRARVLPAPAGAPLERVQSLLNGAAATKSHGVPVELTPAEAADRVLEALRGWGYLD